MHGPRPWNTAHDPPHVEADRNGVYLVYKSYSQ